MALFFGGVALGGVARIPLIVYLCFSVTCYIYISSATMGFFVPPKKLEQLRFAC